MHPKSSKDTESDITAVCHQDGDPTRWSFEPVIVHGVNGRNCEKLQSYCEED